MKEIAYISVPFRYGCNREGVQFAPSILFEWMGIEASQHISFCSVNETRPSEDTSYFGVKHYNAVLAMTHQLRDCVAQALRNDKRVITIGGDHSVGLGSIAGALQYTPNLGVIWFDAHGDINTEYSSPSGNAHGMPVAALLGLCQSDLNNVATTKLKSQNIFWVGVRDLDPEEKDILKNLGIADHVYSSEDIHRKGMSQVMSEIHDRMNKQCIPSVHISFDIDGMDPIIVAATGTKVPQGLSQEELNLFLQCATSLPPIQSMDFVEYNPLMDDASYTTGHWCANILTQFIQLINSF